MMTSLAAQFIDQQVSGIVERHADLLAGELRLGNDEQKIEAAEVLVRIYELERHDDALVEAITFATNSQNPVDLRDLRANDRQQDLATSISGLGYRYRTKREDRAPAADEFTSAAVAEAVLAVWRRRPHQARFRGRDHFGAATAGRGLPPGRPGRPVGAGSRGAAMNRQVSVSKPALAAFRRRIGRAL